MTQVSNAARTAASDPENWAPIIREEVEAAGCRIVLLPEHVSHEEAGAMMADLKGQLEVMRA